jgi:hypothetical protein
MEGFEGCGVVARLDEEGWVRYGPIGKNGGSTGWGTLGGITKNLVGQFECGAPCQHKCCKVVLCPQCAIRWGVTW